MRSHVFLASSLAVVLGAPALAHAQDAPTPSRRRPAVGDDASGIFAVENVFGFTETTGTESSGSRSRSQSFDDKGFFPGFYGPRLSIHGVSGHVTYGTLFGAWWTKQVGKGSDNASSYFALSVAPRIGYIGAVPKQPLLGFWLRTGPSFIYVHGEAGGGSSSSSQNAGYFSWAIEAYGLIMPVDHFGIFVGPSFDIAIYGRASDRDIKLGIIALGTGLMVDW